MGCRMQPEYTGGFATGTVAGATVEAVAMIAAVSVEAALTTTGVLIGLK